ncbi:MAG: NAD(P)-dependent oxidoreductase [Bacteroidetes bacterium]|nr:MAG: NAD(P)-dependent oxidoreductase [Bacteroidota bacterium]
MKLLITGSNGLLGQKLVDYCLQKEIDFIPTSKGESRNSKCPEDRYVTMDITNRDEVMEVITKYKPSHVIHTAAMTNVDQCELNPDACELINVTATKYLVEACNHVDAHFQLLSTDFVFDGEKGNYVEEDPVNPLSIYAKSKVDAEEVVNTQSTTDNSIVRTIIVYGNAENLTKSNIIAWAKTALEKGDPLTIVDDQFRAPTWAEDLATGCMGVLEHNETGVFHVSGPETMSIYDLVIRIGKYFGLPTEQITKISSTTLNQAAKRPPKTGFDLTKAYERIHYKPHTLEETLEILYSN